MATIYFALLALFACPCRNTLTYLRDAQSSATLEPWASPVWECSADQVFVAKVTTVTVTYEELGNLDVWRSRGAPEDLLGDVLCDEGLQAFVDCVGSVPIAAESGHAEFRLNHLQGRLIDQPSGPYRET